jgi:murein DD-endopeptidase MepM/ murein hydrolase activator NlpD
MNEPSPVRRLLATVALVALAGVACGQQAGVHALGVALANKKHPAIVAQKAGVSSQDGGLGKNGPLFPEGVPTIGGKSGGSKGGGSSATPDPATPQPVNALPPGKRVVPVIDGSGVPKLYVLANSVGPLYACPVAGEFRVGDDWHAPRYAGGFHLHQGNDIFANPRTPIVAPFDGVAVDAANTLGGNAVIIYGQAGYVYNAHLIAYGRLGRVQIGDVIGYVGNSGDASGGPYHDHFEWHPNNGPAVDPFPFLKIACT